MAKICFVTYEIHPTNRGGCGVLLHHAAELLLRERVEHAGGGEVLVARAGGRVQ